MKKLLPILIALISISSIYAQDQAVKRVTSTIDSSMTGELVLIQEFDVKASLEEVWKAYTTAEAWKKWVAPLAEVDLKIGGQFRANYNKEGTIGDSTTIINNIINYVPHRLITLQAELSEHFPEFMKADSKRLFNVVYFDPIDELTTNVKSYGIGYKNNNKYKALLKFFISGNEMSYLNLIN